MKVNLNDLDAVEIYKLLLQKEIGKFPNGFWQRPEALQNAIKVTRYLLENILKWNDQDIKQNLNRETFKKNKLMGMLTSLFHGSPYECINLIYPSKFKQWEFYRVTQNYWNLETGVLATKWLIEEKLKWNKTQLIENLSISIFREYGLEGMLHVLNITQYDLINLLYPNQYKPWDFQRTINSFWDLNTGINAIHWLVEEKLKLDTNISLREQLTKKIFVENNLGGMLRVLFNNNIPKAINAAYPTNKRES